MIRKRGALGALTLDPVEIPVGDAVLEGALTIPQGAGGAVLFAHGSGSSRFSPRNRFVAGHLTDRGLGTLLVDLMTPREDAEEDRRFDIEFLTERLEAVTRWFWKTEFGGRLRTGYFGASTGAAAALRAAADLGSAIGAVVSRGGRPDLAEGVLDRVKAPTLLVVGGNDHPVLEWNREAFESLGGAKSLVVVPGATHLFEEPGTLEMVAREASSWFECYLVSESGAGQAPPASSP